MRVIERIVEAPYRFLKRYFKRNLSEAGFSADKRRFGWLIRQRREDRREMALFAVGLWHNVFAVRVVELLKLLHVASVNLFGYLLVALD